MARGFDSDWFEEFIDGAARAAFAITWADHAEARGQRLGPVDIVEVAPETPLWAYVWAGMMTSRYEEANKTAIYSIAQRAGSEADKNPSLFGHYFALMALGHGVSWFDDHRKFALKVPLMEFDYYDESEGDV